jgi:hypothetical protein
MKDRQDNVQKKQNKRTNNDTQHIHIKLKIEYIIMNNDILQLHFTHFW